MAKAIKVENLSKAYQIGEFSTGTLSRDIERWWALARGKEDPFLKIGETNVRSSKGESNVVWSLKDLNFEVEQGEAIGIIGKNGAGKSTLLKVLSQVTTPTTGTIKMKGRVASLLEVGTGFHPELTGRENIYLNGAILGMQKAEVKKKFDEIVDFSGVERYIDTPVKRYSSGMYVRLAFAVAAHLDSEILIVDEVLSVGDAEFQEKCVGKMEDVSKGEGRSILFVSHVMPSVRSLCKKTILLEDGEITLFSDTDAVLDRYLNQDYSDSDINGKYKRDVDIGNRNYTIKRIRLTDENKNDLNNFYISNRHYVELSIKVQKPTKVQLSLILTTADGVVLFGSLNNHEENYYRKNLDVGNYLAYVELPENFLNDKKYKISVSSYGLNENFYGQDILQFEALDDGSLRKDYTGNYGGVIRPKLNWSMLKG